MILFSTEDGILDSGNDLTASRRRLGEGGSNMSGGTVGDLKARSRALIASKTLRNRGPLRFLIARCRRLR